MAIIGIVAEFNPFHNGHRLLIEKSRRMLQPQAVICVMSGPFVQRGQPALCDKWARTRMALSEGVDIVLELPFCYAARSAYYFARGALLTLQEAGATHLAFGSESGDLSRLNRVATLLGQEPPQWKKVLKDGLARGLSFPAARARAITHVLNDNSPEMEILLKSPNNILGLEYLRVIHELRLPIHPLTIRRQGSPYHARELSELASATAIRHAIIDGWEKSSIAPALPASSLAILQKEIECGRAPIPENGLEMAILSHLRLASPAELKGIYEIREGLENRLLSAAKQHGSLPELCHAISSKRYNLTRVKRMLLYSLFSLSKNQMTRFDRFGPQYLRLLGFSSKGLKILQKLKNNSSLPILSTGRQIAQVMQKTSADVKHAMLALDIQAQDVSSLLKPNPAQRGAGQDYRCQVIQG